MTIGEKIKYCRKQIGITQDKLAELTGIHPVSIRKYETNKMQPQPPQLEKIAAALGVSYNALNGSDTAGLRLETVGDLMGVLMVLCNSGILQISGERGEDNLLKDNTVSIHLNPVLSSYLEIRYTKGRGAGSPRPSAHHVSGGGQRQRRGDARLHGLAQHAGPGGKAAVRQHRQRLK